MLMKDEILKDKNGLFDLSDSEKLADIINHDIMKLKLMEIAEVTHFYDCNFLEEVFKKVEFLLDIDRFIGIVKTHWEIDVYNRRVSVVRFDPKIREYLPYVPDLPKKLDLIRERIAHIRELNQKLDIQWEEWEVEHQSPSTKTDAPHFGPFNPSSVEVSYDGDLKIDNLDINVQGILNVTNDDDFAELVDICRFEIWPWLNSPKPKKSRPKKDANVIRFAFRYYGIVDENCSVKNFVLLFNAMVPQAGLIDDTVSSREDANMKSSDFFKYDDLPNYNPLKKDTEQLYKMLIPVINKLV